MKHDRSPLFPSSSTSRAPRVRAWTLALGLLAACGDPPPPREVSRLPEAKAPAAGFVRVEDATEVVLGVLPAEVVLPPDARMELGPPLGGRVASWAVGPGDRIERGALLANLSTPDLADLQASLREAERVLEARAQTVAVERRAMAQGLAAVTSVQALEVAAAEARARRDALRAQLEARKAAMDSAESAGADGTWRWTSPVAGVVERLEVPVGTTLSPDSKALVLVDASRALVRAHVPERWLEGLGEVEAAAAAGRPALSARFTPAGAEAPVPLRFVRRAPGLEPQSRTQAFDFTAESPLAPGRSGRVELARPLGPEQRALAVPAAALTRLGEDEVVFVRRAAAPPAGAAFAVADSPPDDATPVPVVRVGRLGEAVIVTAREPGALAAGAEVAVDGLFRLKSRHVLGATPAEAP